MEKIKNWYNNFKCNNLKCEYFNNDIHFETNFCDTDKYIINSIIDGNYNDYLKYFWDTNKMCELNSNIINNIELIERKDNYQIIHSKFDLKTKYIDIGIIERRDKLFLERFDGGFIVYIEMIPEFYNNKSIHNIEYSFSHIKVQKYNNNKTNIDIIIECKSDIPIILKKIPGILILKTLLNLKNLKNNING